MKLENKWASYTTAILLVGLALQLLGSYGVGLWGARIGAAKWLVGVLNKISPADDPVLREVGTAAGMLAQGDAFGEAEAAGSERVEALFAERLGTSDDRFWAWLPHDGGAPTTSDHRCRHALVDADAWLPVGAERVVRCDGLAVLVARVPEHPTVVVGIPLDDRFAERLARLTGGESVVFVGSDRIATSLGVDRLGLTMEALPLPEAGRAVGFGSFVVSMENYRGFDMGDGEAALQVSPEAPWYLATRTFSREGLTIVALVPEEVMTLGAFYNTMFTIPVSLVLLVLMGLVVWRLVARFTRPISALMSSAHAVSAGDLDRTVPVPESPEMRELCQGYNAMLEKLRDTIDLRQQLAREVGRSEVATGVLHNVGNVLNGVNVSVGLALESVRGSRLPNLVKAIEMLREHADDLGTFLRDDPRGRNLLPYLDKLGEQLVAERDRLAQELENLDAGVDHIKNVVRTQQSYAKAGGLTERCRLADLVDDALRLEAASLGNHRIEVVRDDAGAHYVTVDKHKALQILVNLLTNAKQAVIRLGRGTGRITVRSTCDEGRARIEVVDDGDGITEETMGKIFGYGFTTSRDGHGFGLHNSANAANEMGGSLHCHSEGAGRGATFTLELPAA